MVNTLSSFKKFGKGKLMEMDAKDWENLMWQIFQDLTFHVTSTTKHMAKMSKEEERGLKGYDE